MESRIPPQAVEVEESILGAMLLSHEDIDVVFDILSPDDLYKPSHQIIYNTMRRLFSERKPIDLLTVEEELKDEGEFETVGEHYLSDLTKSASVNIEYHAQIIKEKAIKRRIIESCAAVMNDSYNGKDVYDVIDTLNRFVDTVDSGSTYHSLTPSEIFEREKNAPIQERLFTGESKLDYGLYAESGMKKGHVNLIIAESGHGKSSYAQYLAECLLRKGRRLLWFQLEDYDVNTAIHFEKNCPKQMDNLKICQDLYDIEDIKREARTVNREADLDGIVFDYVQNIEVEKRERTSQVEYISQQITRLAKDLNVVCFPLSQVTIADNKRSGWKLEPGANDVRWSRQLKQDAHAITSVFRPSEVEGLAASLDQVKDWNGTLHPINSVWLRQCKVRYGLREFKRLHMIHTDKGLKPYEYSRTDMIN